MAHDVATEQLSPGAVLLEDDRRPRRPHDGAHTGGRSASPVCWAAAATGSCAGCSDWATSAGRSASTASRSGFARPADAIRADIGFVPGERRAWSRDESLGARQHPSAEPEPRQSSALDRSRGRRPVVRGADGAARYPAAPVRHLRVGSLSGGNQQKVILAKWLARDVACCCSTSRRTASTSPRRLQIHTLIRKFAKRRRRRDRQLQRSRRTGTHLRQRLGLAVRARMHCSRIERDDGFDEGRLRAAIGGGHDAAFERQHFDRSARPDSAAHADGAVRRHQRC